MYRPPHGYLQNTLTITDALRGGSAFTLVTWLEASQVTVLRWVARLAVKVRLLTVSVVPSGCQGAEPYSQTLGDTTAKSSAGRRQVSESDS